VREIRKKGEKGYTEMEGGREIKKGLDELKKKKKCENTSFTRGQCYKTFYGRMLRLFIIS
jgi:hypothetical protein